MREPEARDKAWIVLPQVRDKSRWVVMECMGRANARRYARSVAVFDAWADAAGYVEALRSGSTVDKERVLREAGR